MEGNPFYRVQRTEWTSGWCDVMIVQGSQLRRAMEACYLYMLYCGTVSRLIYMVGFHFQTAQGYNLIQWQEEVAECSVCLCDGWGNVVHLCLTLINDSLSTFSCVSFSHDKSCQILSNCRLKTVDSFGQPTGWTTRGAGDTLLLCIYKVLLEMMDGFNTNTEAPFSVTAKWGTAVMIIFEVKKQLCVIIEITPNGTTRTSL